MTSISLARQSNMELLRIIAMFFILVLHANYLSLGYPSLDAIISGSFGDLFRVFMQSVAIIAVNLFVLLSGYFRIQVKKKSVLNFLYYCFFYAVVGYILVLLLNIYIIV